MPTDAQQTPFHDLLYKIQDQIARTGTCNSNDLKTANDALSSDGLNLNDKDAHGNSLKQIILGRNRWRTGSTLCLPPILPLLKHPLLKKNIDDIKVNDICLVPLHQSDARLRIGIFLGGLIFIVLPCGLAVGSIALGIGALAAAASSSAGFLSIFVPTSLTSAATTMVLGGTIAALTADATANEISQARMAGLQYMSGYNQIIEAIQTNNEILIDASLERLTNTQTPTKQQKMVASAVIRQIPDLNLRRGILRIAVGEGTQGTHAPLYQFFNYKRGLFAPSATRGTLKLLHGELKNIEKQLGPDAIKDKEMLGTAAYTQQILAKEQRKAVAKPVAVPHETDTLLQQFPAVSTAPLPEVRGQVPPLTMQSEPRVLTRGRF